MDDDGVKDLDADWMHYSQAPADMGEMDDIEIDYPKVPMIPHKARRYISPDWCS